MGRAASGVLMIQFADAFRERMRRKLARYAEIDRQRMTSKLRVVTEKGDDQLSTTTIPGSPFHWSSEERGPSPLAYFLSSLGMCQCVHYAEHAAAEGIRIDSLRIEAEGTFTLSHPRGFEDISYVVRIESPEEPPTIRRLFETAADDCFVTQTLRKACRVQGRLILNGAEVAP